LRASASVPVAASGGDHSAIPILDNSDILDSFW
jgi:hypothetical protein